MKLEELAQWAADTYGEHSHKHGQVLAALGPLGEWLSHLARHGVQLEVQPLAAMPAPTPEPVGLPALDSAGEDDGKDSKKKKGDK